MTDKNAPAETTESTVVEETTEPAAKPTTDRVQMVSRRADGTPDQTEGFVELGKDD